MIKLRESIALSLAVMMVLSAVGPTAARAAAAEPETTQPETAEPQTTGTVRGTLIDSNGRPLAGYSVKVVDVAGKIFGGQPTDPDGKYEIATVPAGTYTFQIFDTTGAPISARIPPIVLEAGTILTQPIAIVPHQKDKGALMAWLVGGGVAVAAIALAAANNDDDDGGGKDKSMSPSRIE